MADTSSVVIPTFRVPARQMVTALNLLLQLDSAIRPGLTEVQLQSLLVRCSGCSLIMTRRVGDFHQCGRYIWEGNIGGSNAVIDLTGE